MKTLNMRTLGALTVGLATFASAGCSNQEQPLSDGLSNDTCVCPDDGSDSGTSGSGGTSSGGSSGSGGSSTGGSAGSSSGGSSGSGGSSSGGSSGAAGAGGNAGAGTGGAAGAGGSTTTCNDIDCGPGYTCVDNPDDTFDCVPNDGGTPDGGDSGLPECQLGDTADCTTSCGVTPGKMGCQSDLTWGPCIPPVEICGNGKDDNCMGGVDDGCMNCIEQIPVPCLPNAYGCLGTVAPNAQTCQFDPDGVGPQVAVTLECQCPNAANGGRGTWLPQGIDCNTIALCWK